MDYPWATFKVIRIGKRREGRDAAQFKDEWAKAQRAVVPAPEGTVQSFATGEVAQENFLHMYAPAVRLVARS